MKHWKEILLGLVLSFGSVHFVYAYDYGIDATQQATKGALPNTIVGVSAGSNVIPELVGRVVQIALSLFGIIFFLIILYAGFNWMTAQGNSEKIDQSKSSLQNAAIGLIVVLGAYAITSFVFSSLSSTGGDVSANNINICEANINYLAPRCVEVQTDCASPAQTQAVGPGCNFCCFTSKP